MKEYRPKIIILLEPRISGDTADAMCKKLGGKEVDSVGGGQF